MQRTAAADPLLSSTAHPCQMIVDGKLKVSGCVTNVNEIRGDPAKRCTPTQVSVSYQIFI
ncbi:MAG: hypothetical protein KAW93_04900 [Methanogenium sp.]|nr:hypothetical protein [Methanogenium sp.]